jgi:hypothetical protein
MFICDACGKPAPANTRCTRIIAESEIIEHPFRSRAMRVKKEEGRWEDVPDQGGVGVQTVRELKVCVNCAPGMQNAAPKNLGGRPIKRYRRDYDED